MALQQLQRCLVHVRSDQEELRPCLSQKNDVRILVHEREREREGEGGRERECQRVRERDDKRRDRRMDGHTKTQHWQRQSGERDGRGDGGVMGGCLQSCAQLARFSRAGHLSSKGSSNLSWADSKDFASQVRRIQASSQFVLGDLPVPHSVN